MMLRCVLLLPILLVVASGQRRAIEMGSKGGKSSSEEEPPECVCDGLTSYKFSDSTFSTWEEALDNTPVGCYMAPITSATDLEALVTTASTVGKTGLLWVGIRKSEGLILEQAAMNFNRTQRTEGWFNVDGSPVPSDESLWFSGNNSPQGKSGNNLLPNGIASLSSDLLLDVSEAPRLGTSGGNPAFGAYLCCTSFQCFKEEIMK